MTEPERESLLDVHDLCTYFPVRRSMFSARREVRKAVDRVSFNIVPGRTFGLVGESGSGKTTLGRTLLRLQPATAGEVFYRGRNIFDFERAELAQFRREVQIVQQDPLGSLNPRMTVGRILTEPLIVHRAVARRERRRRVAEMLELVGIDSHAVHRFPHEFSGGQRQRICIARALILQPSLVICDEPVSALDLRTQAQILDLLKRLQRELDLSYLFISHNLAVVRQISDEVAVMHHGRIVEHASAEQLFRDPQHPYTQQLLASIPMLHTRRRSSESWRDIRI